MYLLQPKKGREEQQIVSKRGTSKVEAVNNQLIRCLPGGSMTEETATSEQQ